MTVLHGTMAGAEVDALRVPLKKKLTAISDLPGHIVAFRGTLGRLVPYFRRCHIAIVPYCSYTTTQRPTKSRLGKQLRQYGKIHRLLKLPVPLFLHTVSWDSSFRRMATTRGCHMGPHTVMCAGIMKTLRLGLSTRLPYVNLAEF